MSNSFHINQSSISTDYLGLMELLKYYKHCQSLWETVSTLDISNLSHLDANLSAVILAIAYKLKVERKVKVNLRIGTGQDIFFRNGLIALLNGKKNEAIDDRESTIPLKCFRATQDEEYSRYIKKEFLSHRGLESLPFDSKRAIATHYDEVFVNVEIHAETHDPLFVCGQYFPAKRLLKFTLVDLGIGFLRNISQFTNGTISDDSAAILWATRDLNSTKDPKYGPGGTGLKFLRDYCEKKNGSLHICSGFGYVTLTKSGSLEKKMPISFPGSVINIIFRDI